MWHTAGAGERPRVGELWRGRAMDVRCKDSIGETEMSVIVTRIGGNVNGEVPAGVFAFEL